MNSHSVAGMTLLELLVVISVVSILTLVSISGLFRAVSVAKNRAALAYASNVYKAASAYIAEDAAHTLVSGDCSLGYTAGNYNILPADSVVQLCSITDPDGDRLPTVVVTSTLGEIYTLPST
ncbi:MAG: type II secretion system protein [Deinococcaceae bacterium]